MRVFDEHWFKKHQSKLLWLIRSPLGNLVFRYRKMGHYVNRKRLVKITPNSVAEFVGYEDGEPILREHFFVRNEYAYKLAFYLYPVWFLMHTWDNLIANPLKQPQWNFGFDTWTVNPGSFGTDSPVDGYIGESDANWTTARTASAGNEAAVHNGTSGWFVRGSKSDVYYITRGFFGFNTNIGAAAMISAVTPPVLSLAGSGNASSNANTTTIKIVAGTPAATTDLVVEDYDQVGSTAFASMNIASYNTTAGTYNDFTLDSNGIANINKTGVSVFATRSGTDFTPATPTGHNYAYCRYSENAATKPKLVITYTPGVTFIPQIIIT